MVMAGRCNPWPCQHLGPNVVSAYFNANHQWQVRGESDTDWSSLTIEQATADFTLSEGRLSRFIAILNDIQVAGTDSPDRSPQKSIDLSAKSGEWRPR